MLQDENGHISGPRTVVAGFGAGFTESLLAVTPFESIKTQLFVYIQFLGDYTSLESILSNTEMFSPLELMIGN
jgi:hypothetical protein